MIIYFSGTGNSAYIARLLAEKLGEKDLLAIDSRTLELSSLDAGPTKRVVWCFPVYSWGVPPVVCEFMEKIEFGPQEREIIHHVVFTCGDDIGYADCRLRKLMTRLGWKSGHIATVKMPNIYTLMKGFDVDPVDVEKRKLADAPGRVDKIAADILAGNFSTDVVSGKFGSVKSSVIYPWFVRFAMNPKPFHAENNCIGCCKCAKRCPMNNIEMSAETGRPTWSDDCALCLRCYHFCPVNAVQYGRKTRGKGQYRMFSDTEF